MKSEYKLMATIKNNGVIEKYIVKHKERNDFVKAISYDKLKILVENGKVDWLKINNNRIDIDRDSIDNKLKPFKFAMLINNKIKRLYEEAKKVTFDQLADMAVLDRKYIKDDYITSTILGMYRSNKNDYLTFIIMYNNNGLVDQAINLLKSKNGIIRLEPHPSKYMALAIINANVLLNMMKNSEIRMFINTKEMGKSLNIMNEALNIMNMTIINDDITSLLVSEFDNITNERIKNYEANT